MHASLYFILIAALCYEKKSCVCILLKIITAVQVCDANKA